MAERPVILEYRRPDGQTEPVVSILEDGVLVRLPPGPMWPQVLWCALLGLHELVLGHLAMGLVRGAFSFGRAWSPLLYVFGMMCVIAIPLVRVVRELYLRAAGRWPGRQILLVGPGARPDWELDSLDPYWVRRVEVAWRWRLPSMRRQRVLRVVNEIGRRFILARDWPEDALQDLARGINEALKMERGR